MKGREDGFLGGAACDGLRSMGKGGRLTVVSDTSMAWRPFASSAIKASAESEGYQTGSLPRCSVIGEGVGLKWSQDGSEPLEDRCRVMSSGSLET